MSIFIKELSIRGIAVIRIWAKPTVTAINLR